MDCQLLQPRLRLQGPRFLSLSSSTPPRSSRLGLLEQASHAKRLAFMPIVACELSGCVSASDLVSWRDAVSYVPNGALSLTLAAIGVNADPCALYHRFFHEIEVGHGDVFLFTSREDPQGLFVIDLYRGLTDQLDLVHFGVRCSADRAGAVRAQARRFFDSAEYQVAYEEGSFLPRLKELIDRDSYPRKVQESGYVQQFIER